jgi:aarF domain-containing kinase
MRDNMLDRCPVSSYAAVVATVFEDLGATPAELFAEFDPEPIASASLAQVHAARDHSGRRLAVKVRD